ncbi:hypothetical protein [Streptomyces sp. NPDC087212]|uniref:hypothetical protein n=1 Tax=Streptomyces sp. NPDC087212 TaxID=3365766 RepID=UPI0038252C79
MTDQTTPDNDGQAPAADAVPPLPDQPPAPPLPAPVKDRRVLRAVLRWGAAVVVFAVVGGGVAFGVTGVERTELPGLATESDGRWTYPTLTRAPLPKGLPGPFAESNKAGVHYADLRALLLPAPNGATPDRALRATADGFYAEYGDKGEREALRLKLVDHGLRDVAARGWSTPDGIRTRVYLLRFAAAAAVDDLFADDNVSDSIAPSTAVRYRPRDTSMNLFDDSFPDNAAVDHVQRYAYAEAEPYGAEQTRHAYLAAGDVLALVVQARKGGVADVPFQQTVVVQSQLLG